MIDQLNKTSSSNEAPGELRRHLHNRHIQLIALGGAIGTGLFMGSGKTISLAGPSIIFVYMIIGFMLFFVMRAMGELLLSNPSTSRSVTLPPTCLARGQVISQAGLTGSAGWRPALRTWWQ